MIRREPITEEKALLLGRTVTDDRGLRLEWTCSGFRCRFVGSRLAVEWRLEDIPPALCPYLRIAVDGDVRVAPVSAPGWLEAAGELPYGPHTVEIRKITEPIEGTFLHAAAVEIGARGERPAFFGAPPPPARRKIEFVGDSITCGYGNRGAEAETAFHTGMEDGWASYAALTARAFGADIHFVGKSGEGIVRHCSGERGFPIPEFYPLASPSLRAGWDFSLWQPDLVIINAGTNDAAAGVDPAALQREAAGFLRAVRRRNPRACLLWVYGAMNTEAEAPLRAAVGQAAKEDERVLFHRLERVYARPEDRGFTGHPNLRGHERLAGDLIPLVSRLTGWQAAGTTGTAEPGGSPEDRKGGWL